MTDISFDVPEGYYTTPFTATASFGPDVRAVQFSVNGAPPTVSKYIAYDTLTPPKPFIAVTQDGKGNVVYDGGFPKLYNTRATSVTATKYRMSLDFAAVRIGVLGIDNPRCLSVFSRQSVTIAAGDKLVYDVLNNSKDVRAGIDAVSTRDPVLYPKRSVLRDWETKLVDQNGIDVVPKVSIESRALDKWYHREIDLTQCAGETFVKWNLAIISNVAMSYIARFADVYIIDRNGNVKATLFKDSVDVASMNPEDMEVVDYKTVTKTFYDPRTEITGVFKYAANVLLWIANLKKITRGNRKILILGDQGVGSSYSITGTGGNGFQTSLTKLCQAIGYIPTFKVPANYTSRLLDPTADELKDYTCVLLMSSKSSNIGSFTDNAVNNLVGFRNDGNGLYVITDHGDGFINNIDEAYPMDHSAFYASANQLVKNFGAYFTGNWDRTAVSVGHIRSTYGDHPLFATMDDSDTIAAGPSESQVYVAEYPTVTPTDVKPFSIGYGKTIIQIAVTLNSGAVTTAKVEYNVVAFKITFTDGVTTVDNGQTLDVGVRNQAIIRIGVSGPHDDMTGIVYKDGVRIGTYSNTVAGGEVQTLDGQGFGAVKLNNGNRFSVVLDAPFTLSAEVKVYRFQPDLSGLYNLAEIMRIIRPHKPGMTDPKVLDHIIDEIASTAPWLGLKFEQNYPIDLKLLTDYFLDRGLASLVLPTLGYKAYTRDARPWANSATDAYRYIEPENPVTGVPFNFGHFMFSPKYGHEVLPANFKMDYYANLYFKAGKYQVITQADDTFTFYLDGVLMVDRPGRATGPFAVITITESRYYSAKVVNTNIPVGTPGYWACAFVDMATGEVILIDPTQWKTQEYVTG